jgi:xanthine dehydrogenase molybdopterin-binding subunit B
VARLIKTEKEVEGRYEEVWTLVEEDALPQWPPGPREVVGRDAPRLDGYEKARGEARYTGDVRLPGMLDVALLRSPYARARVRRIDLARAAAAPGVVGVIGPGEVEGAEEEANFEGAVVAAVAALTRAQASGSSWSTSSGRSSSRSSTPTRRSRAAP